jgi:hypothetical protein
MHHPIIVAALLFCAVPQFAQSTQSPASRKTPAEPFVVLELGSRTQRTWNVTTPDVAIPLTFVEQQGKATKITLEATPLLDATGDVVELRLAPSIVLAPYQSRRVMLEASVPAAGTYDTTIRTAATVGKAKPVRAQLTITIARTVVAPPVTMSAIPALQVTNCWFGEADDQLIETTIHSTGGEVTFDAPLLLAPTIKPKADSTAGTSSTMSFRPYMQSVHVAPGSPAKMTGFLTNISQAGRYDAKLRFAPKGYAPVDTDVVVYVRESGAVAFLFILLGVLISLGVQAYGSAIRPRLIVQQRVEELRSKLKAARLKAQTDPEALALIDGIDGAMESKWRRAQQRRTPITTEFDIYETIVPAVELWSAMHRQLMTVRPESVCDKLMPTLTTARDAFLADTPDATTVQSSVTALKKFPDTVRAEVEAALTVEVAKLDEQLVNDPRQSAVAIRTALQLVRDALRDEQIEKAVDAFNAARLRYVVILAEDLRRRVAPSGMQPVGVELVAWQKLQADTNASLDAVNRERDAERAASMLRDAARAYVRTLAAALKSTAAKLHASDQAKIESALQPIETQLIADDLNGAWASLDAAQSALATVLQAQVGGQMGGPELAALAAAAGAPAAPFDILSIFDLPPSWESLGEVGSAARTSAAITAFDILISFIVLIAGTIVGLQVLWIGNPTWGGGISYISAFLWGFAVDQFTHAGVAALSKKT